MVNKCVTNCKSNYDSNSEKGYVTCFKFSTDKTLLEKWLRKIRREGLSVSKYTVVCIKHFQECDIIKYDILPGKNGDPDVKIPRKKFALRKDAFSCIFPNLCSYLSALTTSVRRSSLTKRRKRNEK